MDAESGQSRSNLMMPLVLLALAMIFVSAAAGYRMGRGARMADQPSIDGSDGSFEAELASLPASFDEILANEFEAYRTTCAHCHALPHPKLFDPAGWEGIGRKMKERMSLRIDAAIRYLQEHGREPMRFEPLADLSRIPSTRPTATQPETPLSSAGN